MVACVKIGNKESEPFTIIEGLCQGCCISPKLFKIDIAKAFSLWKRKCQGIGIEIDGDTCIYTLEFADDQVICTNDKENLEYMAKKLNKSMEDGVSR